MFKIILTNNIEDAELLFEIRDTNIAKVWFEELSKNYPIHEDNRFSNWWLNDRIVDDLNQQIDIINSYDNIINQRASVTSSQQDLNYLHKFFEDLRGEVKIGTIWYHNAPSHIKSSLEKLNVLIHQLEEKFRSPTHPTLVVTFKNRPQHILEKDHCKHFTFKWKKGTAYINYCHVGKPILDVYKDNDKITQAVRPQTHYSADFIIKFGPSTNYFIFLIRKIIIKTWLIFQKFEFSNPNLGYIPVADLVGDFNIEDYRKFTKVKKIECIK